MSFWVTCSVQLRRCDGSVDCLLFGMRCSFRAVTGLGERRFVWLVRHRYQPRLATRGDDCTAMSGAPQGESFPDRRPARGVSPAIRGAAAGTGSRLRNLGGNRDEIVRERL